VTATRGRLSRGQRKPLVFTDGTSALTPELWDPATEAFTTMATGTIPRNYHRRDATFLLSLMAFSFACHAMTVRAFTATNALGHRSSAAAAAAAAAASAAAAAASGSTAIDAAALGLLCAGRGCRWYLP